RERILYNILIADDHPLFRGAIINVIQNEFPGCTICESDTLDGAVVLAEGEENLDLILLDLDMPGMNGMNGLISLRNAYPTIPVVIVSAEKNKQVVIQAITCGAVGFIAKSSSREQMGAALQQILDGNVYLPPDIIRVEGNGMRSRSDNSDERSISPEAISSLTRRQLLVLKRMAKGESNKQIAYNLNIAETTVKTHVSAILRKLGVYNRIQAILSAGNIDFHQYLKR
ncbi:unnamed protein product, partial [Cyprideis torosa]